jgi:hypothetical protein
MDEPTTKPTASSDAGELAKLEQAVKDAAGESITPDAQESTAEEAPQAPQFGKEFQDIAEKKGFKSPDDLVRSYRELEAYKTQLEQDRKELLAAVKQTAPQAKDEEELPPQQREALSLLEKVVERVMEKKIAPITESFEVQKAKEEISKVQSKFPDFSGYAVENAIRYVQKNPSLTLEEAHKILSYPTRVQEVQTQEFKAAKSAEKAKAYTESARSAKSGSDIDYSKLSLEEMEAILPKAGQYIDHKGKLRRGDY